MYLLELSGSGYEDAHLLMQSPDYKKIAMKYGYTVHRTIHGPGKINAFSGKRDIQLRDTKLVAECRTKNSAFMRVHDLYRLLCQNINTLDGTSSIVEHRMRQATHETDDIRQAEESRRVSWVGHWDNFFGLQMDFKVDPVIPVYAKAHNHPEFGNDPMQDSWLFYVIDVLRGDLTSLANITDQTCLQRMRKCIEPNADYTPYLYASTKLTYDF